MKLSDLLEMPFFVDGKYIPPEIKTDATSSLAGLKRNNEYLGRIKFGEGSIYDFWLNNGHDLAKITTPNNEPKRDLDDDVNAHDDDSRHTIIGKLEFQPPPPDIPENNKLQVNEVFIHDKHQDQFLAGALYILLVRYGYSVISDFLQFQGGKGLWKSITQRAEQLRYVVRIWDEKTGDWVRDTAGKPLHYTTLNLDDAKIWHDVNTEYGKPATLLVLSKT